VTLGDLRADGPRILGAIDALAANHGRVYAPFYAYGTARELRPTQFYLTKLPATVAAILDLLSGAAAPSSAEKQWVGRAWREPMVVESEERRRAVEVDLEVVERGFRGHVDTEKALAAALADLGIEPRRPERGDPNFDLAWRAGGRLFVAEVKSTTPTNEERQLRLGLGQVLRYRSLLTAQTGELVVALLVPEREPVDPTWADVCAGVDVKLVAAPQIGARLRALVTAPE